jgi:hypothetical protein
MTWTVHLWVGSVPLNGERGRPMTEHGDRVQRIKAVAARLMASPALTHLDEGLLIELDEPMAQVAEELDIALERHLEDEARRSDPLT